MSEKLFKMDARLLPGGKVDVSVWQYDGRKVTRRFVRLDRKNHADFEAFATDPVKFLSDHPKQTPEGGSGS